ncbi:MAG: hypothetical protein IPK14_17780 [Blastocatellia bacterium]|nr:hypothetical protein [Blastocatellia bacterium]
MLRLPKSILVMVCLVIFSSFAMAQDLAEKKDKPEKEVNKIIRLKPTAMAPDATGIIRISFKTPKEGEAKQSFELIGVNVLKDNNYRLFVDGNEITSREAKVNKTEREAVFVIEFTSKKDKEDSKKGGFSSGIPAQLDPVTNIRRVEIRDTNNQVVLVGEFTE